MRSWGFGKGHKYIHILTARTFCALIGPKPVVSSCFCDTLYNTQNQWRIPKERANSGEKELFSDIYIYTSESYTNFVKTVYSEAEKCLLPT